MPEVTVDSESEDSKDLVDPRIDNIGKKAGLFDNTKLIEDDVQPRSQSVNVLDMKPINR